MLGGWLTCIEREDKKLIFMGLLLLFRKFDVLIIILFLRKTKYFLSML